MTPTDTAVMEAARDRCFPARASPGQAFIFTTERQKEREGFAEGWQSRDTEVAALKAENAELLDALRELANRTDNIIGWIAGECGVTLPTDSDDHNVTGFQLAQETARTIIQKIERTAPDGAEG